MLLKEARNLCIFAVTGGNFTSYYRFLKRFYGLADIPTIFQEESDQTLENEHPAWLDDIIVVTKGSKEQQKRNIRRPNQVRKCRIQTDRKQIGILQYGDSIRVINRPERYQAVTGQTNGYKRIEKNRTRKKN